jgi:hypothetical protein
MKRQRTAARGKSSSSKPSSGKSAIRKPSIGKSPIGKAPKRKVVRAKTAAKNVGEKSRKAPRAKAADPVGALVTLSAQALKLPLDPAWHGGVTFNLALILRMGALVDEFALPDDAEPAPVFHA